MIEAPTISIDDVSVTEGNSGATPAGFTVSLDTPSTETVTVDYATADGSATAGLDYTAASGTLTFLPGQTSKPVSVDVLGDLLDEPNETFSVSLSNPVNTSFGDDVGTGTILDDDETVNTPPVAVDDAATTPEDTPVDVNVLANDTDADGHALTITSFTQPAHGTVTETVDHKLHYAPAADFHGTDTFEYTISDGHGGSDTATVTITVTPVNDAPVAFDATRTTPEDTTLSSSVPAATDVDGDTLTYALVAGLPGLTFNADGTFTYMPPATSTGRRRSRTRRTTAPSTPTSRRSRSSSRR